MILNLIAVSVDERDVDGILADELLHEPRAPEFKCRHLVECVAQTLIDGHCQVSALEHGTAHADHTGARIAVGYFRGGLDGGRCQHLLQFGIGQEVDFYIPEVLSKIVLERLF